MIKIVTIIGARPQIIKAAALSRAIRNGYSTKIQEIIVHTGQHYDASMSQVFFDELEIPKPDYNLNVGSGSHGKQTASMISGVEEVLEKEKPHCLVVYGDTNSTLAGAVAASKMHIPIVHIEAGLRSFNKAMPEEVNRIMCDHVSTLLFSPTLAGYNNLIKEGFEINESKNCSPDHPRIYHCGDVMYDNSLYFGAVADERTTIINDLELKRENYVLATIHRNNNTDEPERLAAIFEAFHQISTSDSMSIVIPLHPRTSKLLSQNLGDALFSKIQNNALIKIIPPISFLEMTALEKNAKLIITDSGGVQKEAFFFRKPCIILRAQTEWIELVTCGAARLADTEVTKITETYNYFGSQKDLMFPQIFGDGKAADFIAGEMLSVFS